MATTQRKSPRMGERGLLAGKTQKEAAAEVGVAAETVSRWRSYDGDFVEALSQRRLELQEAYVERLRHLAGRAISTLEALLESRNEQVRLRAAVAVLKAAGLDGAERSKEMMEAQVDAQLDASLAQVWEEIRRNGAGAVGGARGEYDEVCGGDYGEAVYSPANRRVGNPTY